MFPLIEDEGRTEYPFPPIPAPASMDAVEPSSSSSDTLPSAPSRIGSRSSRSSPAPQHHSPRDHDLAYDHEHSWAGTSGKAKLLARLMTRSERDASQYRMQLLLANERLEAETRRADEAEHRAIDTLQLLRQARAQTTQAQADAARASEETRLWKLRLEEAQKEILRAQEIVDRLEQDKLDAEAEAARARTLARKFREERIIAKAREEGRRQGFEEGLSTGRELIYYEVRGRTSAAHREPRRYEQRVVDDMSDEEEQSSNAAGSQPEEIIPITRSPPPQSWQPPSRPDEMESNIHSPPRQPSSPIRVKRPRDIAPPLDNTAVPPPAASPTPNPIPDQSAGRSQSRQDVPINPIPIQNSIPSPSHPPINIPPDNWIPYMSNDKLIMVPPPHELQKPLSPRASSPSMIEATMRVPATVPTTYEQSVRARDFAYTAGAGPLHPLPPAPSAPFSPQSRTSTNISQYEILTSRTGKERAPSHSRSRSDALAGLHEMFGPQNPGERARTPAGQVREDRPPQSPTGPRTREQLASPAPVPEPARSNTPGRPKTPGRPETPGRNKPPARPEMYKQSGSHGTLDRLFRRKWKNRASISSGVPDITVESPSTKEVSPVSTGTVPQPHMLSPELSHSDLPGLEIVQNYINPELMDKDNRPLPPLPGIGLSTPDVMSVLPDGQLPPGFVPLTPPVPGPPIPPDPRDMQRVTGTPSAQYPASMPGGVAHSDTDQTTSSSSRTESDASMSRTAAGRRRSASAPRAATPSGKNRPVYDEAPLPPHIRYPDPPKRTPTPGATTRASSLPSPPRTTTPMERGRLSGALSPLSILSPLRTPH